MEVATNLPGIVAVRILVYGFLLTSAVRLVWTLPVAYASVLYMTPPPPPRIAAAIADGERLRERHILELQAAIDNADGPDEHEQAKAHLTAYLDKIDEQDRTDLARLGYAR